MRVVFRENTPDHDGPVIDIEVFVSNPEEYFDLGVLFQQLKNVDACVWKGAGMLRIPLIKMNEIGLAITYKEENK